MSNVIVYDLETTGLNIRKDKIIEIYLYKINNNTCLHLFIDPQVTIPNESVKIHGITNIDLQNNNAKTFANTIDEIIEFIGKKAYLISHNNIGFDKPFLLNEMKQIGFDKPKQWRFIDTLHIARYLYTDLPNYKQDTLRDKFNISSSNNHRANKDVLDLVKIYLQMIEDLKTKTNNENLTIKDIYKISKNFVYKKMPFGKYKNVNLQDIPEDYVSWLSQNVFKTNRILKKSFIKLVKS